MSTHKSNPQVISLDAARRKRADDLLSGKFPIAALFGRTRDRVAGDLRVEDVLAVYMRGSKIGPSGVTVILGITQDARVRHLNAEQRGHIRDVITALN